MNLSRLRLARSFLLTTSFRNPDEVVRAFGAVQAQDYEGAKWALAQRTLGATDQSINQAFDAGAILRTHVLRPTWHFVDPADIRWMLALTAPHVKRTMAAYDRQLGLDASTFRRSHGALAKALRDRNYLTRAEIKEVLSKARVGPVDVQRTAHLLMGAELDQLIVSGPRRDGQFTYALLDERVSATAPVDRDWGLRELATRYFRTHGPATPQDFGWWSGLRMPDVRRAIGRSAGSLARAEVAGRVYYDGGEATPRHRPVAHLLPNYDEFFIGHRDRSAIGERLQSVRAVTGGNALISHVVVVDGQLVGGWRRKTAGKGVRVELQLLAKVSKAELARVLRTVGRYEEFLGAPVEVRGLHQRSQRSGGQPE